MFMSKLDSRIFTCWCWLGCGLSTAFWGSLSILGSLVSGSERIQHFCMKRWSRDNLWLSRTRVELEGLEYIDRTQSQLLVANHSGLHDILSLAAFLPIRFRWIAKKSLFKVPFMGWHMTRSGYIPIDRDNPREAAKTILAAAKIIKGGVSAIAFPEGKRSRTGDLDAFEGGAFALALRTGTPLVPITLEGSHRVIVPQTFMVNPGVTIRIKIDHPIDVSQYAHTDRRQLMEEVHEIMARNLAELRARHASGSVGVSPGIA
jgi:1-acyl-sn-glycerol-3-phosphate acyltransferase